MGVLRVAPYAAFCGGGQSVPAGSGALLAERAAPRYHRSSRAAPLPVRSGAEGGDLADGDHVVELVDRRFAVARGQIGGPGEVLDFEAAGDEHTPRELGGAAFPGRGLAREGLG